MLINLHEKRKGGVKDIKILILGSSGVVGSHLVKELRKAHEVIGVAKSSESADVKLDVKDEEELEKLIEGLEPEVVVNCVKPALSTDKMEEEKELSYELNAALPERLAKLQRKYKYKLVQISTDWVYEGKKGKQYNESSPLIAKNYYSETKLEAEKKIQKHAADYLIIRTEGVFGIDDKGTNIFLRLKKRAEHKEPMSVPTDQFSQPIYGGELARVIRVLIEKDAKGIFNVVGPQYVSRYEFACELCKAFEWQCELRAFSISGRKIDVPRNLEVDISKVEAIVGKIKSLDEQIEMLKEEIG
ncbi:hypothetical protein DRN67_00755 [Candidatus Micrarchaeota archaeon]|nr:MAG: hypothetical protein DRN67_00755 [Candidatus Micrarchaeota archaeon]